MSLSQDEIKAFEMACANRHNYAVQELYNALGVESPSAVLAQVAKGPRALADHIVRHMREAIHEQKHSAR